MNDILHVALLQTNPVWQNIDANITELNRMFGRIPENTHLTVLPEMFLTGFSMDVENIGQTMEGKGILWLKETAASKKMYLLGSLTIEDRGKYYNRLLIASPDGNIQYYDKRHLFRMGEEHKHFSAGEKILITSLLGWNIMPLVCYDLRFPVWSRNNGLKYDMLVYVANWPEVRQDAFHALLKARAIENQCYVVAVNRTGTDGLNMAYAGGSLVIGPKGEFMTQTSAEPGIINCSLSLSQLKRFREKFPAYLDADNFEIK